MEVDYFSGQAGDIPWSTLHDLWNRTVAEFAVDGNGKAVLKFR